MSLIAKNTLGFKKFLAFGLLLIALIGGASAASALSTTSTANLVNDNLANGNNINIWKGLATLTATNDTTGSNPVMSATIKKSLAVVPDPTVYNHNMQPGYFYSGYISIPDRSTYYAQASTLSYFGNGKVTVKSLD